MRFSDINIVGEIECCRDNRKSSRDFSVFARLDSYPLSGKLKVE